MFEVTTSDGVRLRGTDRGEGDETVVLSHSYLADHRHFAAQIDALAQRYRVIAYDHRGHGASDTPGDGYSMQRITDDGIDLIESLGAGPVHWVGLSTGGFVGMRIALQRPELLKRLVLMDTSAGAEPTLARVKYAGMLAIFARFGMRPVLGGTMKAMFGGHFLRDAARATERDLWAARFAANDVPAIIGFGRAIFARDHLLPQVHRIEHPTLVVVGEDDRATVPARARELAAAIPDARLEIIPRAGHLCTVEEPDAVTEVITRFLGA